MDFLDEIFYSYSLNDTLCISSATPWKSYIHSFRELSFFTGGGAYLWGGGKIFWGGLSLMGGQNVLFELGTPLWKNEGLRLLNTQDIITLYGSPDRAVNNFFWNESEKKKKKLLKKKKKKKKKN